MYDTPQPLTGTRCEMELKENVCYGDISKKINKQLLLQVIKQLNIFVLPLVHKISFVLFYYISLQVIMHTICEVSVDVQDVYVTAFDFCAF